MSAKQQDLPVQIELSDFFRHGAQSVVTASHTMAGRAAAAAKLAKTAPLKAKPLGDYKDVPDPKSMEAEAGDILNRKHKVAFFSVLSLKMNPAWWWMLIMGILRMAVGISFFICIVVITNTTGTSAIPATSAAMYYRSYTTILYTYLPNYGCGRCVCASY